MVAANISVEWGYEEHSITLIPRNWNKVRKGKSLSIRGSGYYYEGEFFWDYWYFGGGMDGDLVVSYGEGGGTGFVGRLRDADIVEFEYQEKRA